MTSVDSPPTVADVFGGPTVDEPMVVDAVSVADAGDEDQEQEQDDAVTWRQLLLWTAPPVVLLVVIGVVVFWAWLLVALGVAMAGVATWWWLRRGHGRRGRRGHGRLTGRGHGQPGGRGRRGHGLLGRGHGRRGRLGRGRGLRGRLAGRGRRGHGRRGRRPATGHGPTRGRRGPKAWAKRVAARGRKAVAKVGRSVARGRKAVAGSVGGAGRPRKGKRAKKKSVAKRIGRKLAAAGRAARRLKPSKKKPAKPRSTRTTKDDTASGKKKPRGKGKPSSPKDDELHEIVDEVGGAPAGPGIPWRRLRERALDGWYRAATAVGDEVRAGEKGRVWTALAEPFEGLFTPAGTDEHDEAPPARRVAEEPATPPSNDDAGPTRPVHRPAPATTTTERVSGVSTSTTTTNEPLSTPAERAAGLTAKADAYRITSRRLLELDVPELERELRELQEEGPEQYVDYAAEVDQLQKSITDAEEEADRLVAKAQAADDLAVEISRGLNRT